ncbi:diacylglycerol kinase family lipid kinase [bacterium]|nr:diacylglycerol kinase family lipid kinase [bacterium]
MTEISSRATRNVLAIFNPQSGVGFRPSDILNALREPWDSFPDINLTYQESRNIEDGVGKIRRAMDCDVDTVIVIGGDGMVNTLGAQLIGTDVKLAVLPAGSGNGFARHFDIPNNAEKAAKALIKGEVMEIDVGFVNDHPFFVTASLAWDAELVADFEKMPIRGIAPYVFAGIYKYFTYEPQDYHLNLDGEEIHIEKPLLLTAANLTQYGGGAKIAPEARADDGLLTLVAVPRMEPHELLLQIRRLFDGSISKIPELKTWQFKKMTVQREQAGKVQVDGELMDADKDVVIEVKPKALKVIVPKGREKKDD